MGFEEASSSGVVMLVSTLVWDSVIVGLFSFSSSVPAVVETALSVLSSRFMLITGISRAVLMYFSSSDGGSPFLTMRSAFASRTSRSLGWERRYMVSSPASTVSHILRILVSIMDLREVYCDNNDFQCGEADESESR